MKRKPSLKTLRNKLDRVFADWIRLRGANPSTGFNSCVTCGARRYFKELHAGHFIKRQHLATRYDPRNCHPQCVRCNTYRGGELIEYYRFMLKRYGPETIDELMKLKRTTVRFRREDYERMIKEFSS